MELSESILSELKQNPGQTAVQLAKKLNADKTNINSMLYGRLKGQCYQDKQYKWYPANKDSASTKTSTPQEQFANTPLSKLCRYYLSCLGQDDEGGVSVFAAAKFGDLDYVELDKLPINGATAMFQSQGAQRLLGKLRKDRSRLAMYLGYPATLKKVHSKKSDWVGCFVEPALLFPIELDQATGSPQISQSFPIVNLSVLKRFTNSEREAVMNELVQLEDELGLTNSETVPDLDELVQRLFAIRDEWPWKEPIDPANLVQTPTLSNIIEEGIYNRAVLLVGERSPFTQGLESELKSLAQLNESAYAATALGHWVAGDIPSTVSKTSKQLIEVLPLNIEQRQSVMPPDRYVNRPVPSAAVNSLRVTMET
jgi:hypothetical protein